LVLSVEISLLRCWFIQLKARGHVGKEEAKESQKISQRTLKLCPENYCQRYGITFWRESHRHKEAKTLSRLSSNKVFGTSSVGSGDSGTVR